MTHATIPRWAPVATVILSLVALFAFYGAVYTPHQDLSGSVLSGALSNALGAEFPTYSIYFPPAERIWFAGADRLGRITGLGGNQAAILMTGLAVVASASLATAIRARTTGARPGFFLISFLVLVIVPILYKNVFGLREHMVVLGLWPWLVLRAAPVDAPDIGRGLRVGLGLWMGTTLTFKYLYAVVVILVELVDALARRSVWSLFRIENLVSGGVVALYLGLWLGTNSEMREAIGAMRSAISANLRSPEVTLILLQERAAVILIFLIAGRLFGVSGRHLAIGLAVVTGAIVVAWAQGRWYSHHRFPIVMGYLVWWWLIGNGFPKWAHSAAAVFFALVISREFPATSRFQADTDSFRQALRTENIDLDGQRVGLLTQHPSPYNEVIAAEGGTRWAPFMNIAYVSAELQPLDTAENADTVAPPVRIEEPGRAMLHGQLLSLWEDHPPDALIFDRTHRWPLRYLIIDWARIFSGDPRFTAIMEGYRLEVSYEGPGVDFDYYVRTD